MNYPYYIIVTHEGRLPTPPQFRGTPMARQFETGRIGGVKCVEKDMSSKESAVSFFRRAKMLDANAELYVVEAPNKPRRKVHNPQRELS